MRRLLVTCEAQPTDPVSEGVLLVEGLPASTRPSAETVVDGRVRTSTGATARRPTSVYVSVVQTRWTREDLTQVIIRDAAAAAAEAGLVLEPEVVRKDAERIARRVMSPWRRLARAVLVTSRDRGEAS